MSTDEEAQQDEMLAMESIFEGDAFKAHPGAIRSGLIKVRVDLPDPFYINVENEDEVKNTIPLVAGINNGLEIKYKVEYLPPLMLHFTMPKNYPSQAKPNFTLSSNWLHRAALTILCQKLDELWEENKGMGILFTWANFLQVDTLTTLGIADFYEIKWLNRPANLSKKNPSNRSPRKGLNHTACDITVTNASGDLLNGDSDPQPHCSRGSGELGNDYSTASNDVINDFITPVKLAYGSTASDDLPAANIASTSSGLLLNGSSFSGVSNVPSTSSGTTNSPTPTSACVSTTSTVSNDMISVSSASSDVVSDSTLSGEVTNVSAITEETDEEYEEELEVALAQNGVSEFTISSEPAQSKAVTTKPKRKRVRKRTHASSKRKSTVQARSLFDPRAVSDRIPPKDGKTLSFQEYLLMFNDDQIRETFMQASHTCDICLTLKSGHVCLRFRCGHVFCRECTTGFFTTNITEGNVDNVKCLAFNCRMRPTPELVKMLVKEELYERYDQILLKRALENMSDVTYCPRPKCHNPVLCDPNEKCALCTKCGYTFCSICKMVYHGVEPCRFKDADMKNVFKKYTEGTPAEKQAMVRTYGEKQLKILVENVLSEQWIKKESKSCPHCKVPIEKFEGCNKVTCFKCNTFFCWLCLKHLETGNPYFHFNDPSSPCYNNLFQNMEDEDEPGDEWLEHLLEEEESDESDEEDLFFYDSDDFDY